MAGDPLIDDAPDDADARYISTSDAARLLCVGTSTVKRWAEIGHLQAIKTKGGHRRFSLKEVEKTAERNCERKNGHEPWWSKDQQHACAVYIEEYRHRFQTRWSRAIESSSAVK